MPHEKPDPGDLSEWFTQTVESSAGPERSSVSDTALITQEPPPPLPSQGLAYLTNEGRRPRPSGNAPVLHFLPVSELE